MARKTQLVMNRQYATYQVCLEVFSAKLRTEEVFSKTQLYIVNWLKVRLGENVVQELPELLEYPSVEKYQEHDVHSKKGFKYISNLDIKAFFLEEEYSWALRIEEPDNREEFKHGSLEDSADIRGRSFVTEIGLCKGETGVTLAVQITCKEPTDNVRDAVSFRPVFIKEIYKDSELMLREMGLDGRYCFQKSYEDGKMVTSPLVVNRENYGSFLSGLLNNEKRQLPVILCPETVKDATYPLLYYRNNQRIEKDGNIQSLSYSLIGYAHVVVIADEVADFIFEQKKFKCPQYTEWLKERKVIFHKSFDEEGNPDTPVVCALPESEKENEQMFKIKSEFKSEIEEILKDEIEKISGMEADEISESENLRNEESENIRNSEPKNLRNSESENLRNSETKNLRNSESENLRISEPENLKTSEVENDSTSEPEIDFDLAPIAALKQMEQEAKCYSIRKSFSFQPTSFYRELRKKHYHYQDRYDTERLVKDLERENEENLASINDLRTKLEQTQKEMRQKIDSLNSKFNQSQTACLDYKKRYEKVNGSNSEYEIRIKTLEKERDDLIRKNEIMFRAYSGERISKPSKERLALFYESPPCVLFEGALTGEKGRSESGDSCEKNELLFELLRKEILAALTTALSRLDEKQRRYEVIETVLQYDAYMAEAGFDESGLLFYPSEFGFFEREVRDIIYDVIFEADMNESVKNYLVDHNDFDFALEEKKRELMSKINSYRQHHAIKGILEQVGFCLKSSKGHYVYTYFGDERYKITVASSPSDTNAGKNVVDDIIEKCL